MSYLSIIIYAFFVLMTIGGLYIGLASVLPRVLSFFVSVINACYLTYLYNKLFSPGLTARLVCFVITFVVVQVILIVLMLSISVLTAIPPIKFINEVGGALCAAAFAFVGIMLFMEIISVFPEAGICKEWIAMIEKDPVLSLIYENNILDSLAHIKLKK